jgi:hypothetical protein
MHVLTKVREMGRKKINQLTVTYEGAALNPEISMPSQTDLH